MRISVLDFETSFQVKNKKKDPSPYHPDNFIVSYGLQHSNPDPWIIYNCVRHSQKENYEKASINILRNWLNQTDLLIAFNAKFELSWLKAIGIEYKNKIADPMIMAYVLARGQKWDMSLESLCIRFEVAQKKSDLVNEYMKDNVSFENIPWDIIEEYGRGDVVSTWQLYLKLKAIIDKDHPYLWPTIKLMHEFCFVLTDMEYAGIKIDLNTLKEIEDQYRKEYNGLEIKLIKIIKEVMGDIPFNLNSPEQMSQLIYSRKVNDKKEWKRIFNLGTELRGSVVKPKYPPKMTNREFTNAVLQNTSVISKMEAQKCILCEGSGYTLGDALEEKRKRKCKNCLGLGLLYISTKDVGGFKFLPKFPKDAAAGGFSTDKQTIEDLSLLAKGRSKEFFELYLRYSALDTYLGTFIDGINAAQINSFIHTSFMQCVTATGRLSSRQPNFQNIPRSKTFEIKEAIISRFKDGIILEADFSQLEFRVAGILSGNEQIAEDIKNKIDVHSVTAKFVETDRQSAKPDTFKPLYGGRPEGEPNPKRAAYYKYFIDRYNIDNWGWPQEVLEKGGYILPSGRELIFPNCKRLWNGYIKGTTQIMNYKTQSFATADIVPIALVKINNLMREANVHSCIILTVHDSVEIDVHPDEIELIINIVNRGMGAVAEECIRRYNVELSIPIEWEVSIGKNWLERNKVVGGT